MRARGSAARAGGFRGPPSDEVGAGPDFRVVVLLQGCERPFPLLLYTIMGLSAKDG